MAVKPAITMPIVSAMVATDIENSLRSFVKFSHTEPFKEYDVISDKLKEELQKNKGISLLDSMPKQLKPRGLLTAKFKTLESLKNSIPESHRSYYDSLKIMINNDLNDWETETVNKKQKSA